MNLSDKKVVFILLRIYSNKIVLRDSLDKGYIEIEGNRITDVVLGRKPEGDFIDMTGKFVLPGLINIHSLDFVKEGDPKQVGIEIHSGQNRVVRRIFEKLGYKVIRLDRVYFAGLTKKSLPRGKYRFLNDREVNMLKMGAYE